MLNRDFLLGNKNHFEMALTLNSLSIFSLLAALRLLYIHWDHFKNFLASKPKEEGNVKDLKS